MATSGQLIVLDSAPTDPTALTAHLEQLLGARVYCASIQRLDLVNDTTIVDVRYHTTPARSGRRSSMTLEARR